MKLFRRSRNRRREKGAAAVEFALVAPVFLAMMFTLFEIGWFHFTNSILDASTANAARLVRTGQVQGWVGDEDQVKERLYNRVCRVAQTWGDCKSIMTVDVQTFPTFAALETDSDTNPPTCADAPPSDLAAIPFEPGADHAIVRVRICILYNTVNPLVGFRALNNSNGVDLAEGDTGKRRLVSTMVFKNEPYSRNILNNGSSSGGGGGEV